MNRGKSCANWVVKVVTAFALIFGLCPVQGLEVEAFAATKTVSTAEQFLSALNNAADGDVIDLGGNSIQINAQTDGNDPIVNKANITIMHCCKVVGALQNQKGMTRYMNAPHSVMNMVFSLSSSTIASWLYPQ